MKKFNFDIEIDDSNQVIGGYILTIENKTKKQVSVEMEKLGREFLKSNPQVERISYSAWEADTEDFENCAHVGIILSRHGRKINVTTY